MHDFYGEYVSSGQSGVPQAGSDTKSGLPYLKWLVRRVALVRKDERIVDAACGSGALVGVLRASGYSDVVGVDLSSEQIAAGALRGITGLVSEDAITYLERLPAASVGAVFALNFLEHLGPDDAVRFLGAARRSLRDDGCLVLHVPNGQSPFCSAVRYGDVTHRTAFTRRSLEQVLFPARLRLDWIAEGKPFVHGVVSLGRRVIWTVGRTFLAILFAAETGAMPDALSQNITALARPRLD